MIHVETTPRHDLLEILTIAFCTVLCGGEDCSDMALFGRAKEPFLRQFLQLRHGIPSHDTFSRVFRLLDPAKFQSCFLQFMECFAEAAQGVIAIDGKTLRRSFDRAADRSPLHLVSAWAAGSRLVLAQVATDDKSNEITAVPKLLEMLSLNPRDRHRRRAQLPARHRRASGAARWRLCPGAERQPGHVA
jgi:DDE_Tnp_1-associated